jgi:general secretion pathway protein I
MRADTCCPGFTLMEVMVAMALIAIVLTSVYHLFSQAAYMGTREDFQTVAPMLAREIMARAQADSEGDPGRDNGAFEDAFRGFVWQWERRPAPLENLGETGMRVMQIDVTIAHDSLADSYHLQAYRLW